jgi:hypothetical protein
MVDGLFGPQPAERVAKQGRPEHVWNRRNSLRICSLFACGHTVADVAAVIGISQPTLRKVYFQELKDRRIMALKVRSEQMVRLTEAAIGGSVPAEKALAGMIQAEQLKVLGDRVDRAQGEAKPKRELRSPGPLGKKAEANLAAQSAGMGTGWGDDLLPQTVN